MLKSAEVVLDAACPDTKVLPGELSKAKARLQQDDAVKIWKCWFSSSAGTVVLADADMLLAASALDDEALGDLVLSGDDAPASADARLVEGGEGGAGIVPVVEGLASAADVGAAAQAAADKGSEALVLRGGDVEVIGPLADTAVPVLRELPFATTTNVDDLDTDAFACKTLGYAGVLLSLIHI